MIYAGILILALLIESQFRFSVIDYLQPITYFLHFHCLERIPLSSSSAPELKAIICGENFTGASSQIFVASGLIHLFVVSGAHLIILEKILISILFIEGKASQIFILSFLFIYALACEMNPPITRSFISILFSLILFHKHLYWPENYKLFLVGVLTLAVNPSWLNSLSLQLSWMAALVVSLSHLYFLKSGILFKQFLFFIFLWPFLIFFQVPSPTIIIANLILTPFLEIFLFPLALLVWLFPFLYTLFDSIILSLKTVLHLLEFKLTYQDLSPNSSTVLFGWALILTTHFILHFTEMNQRRQTHV